MAARVDESTGELHQLSPCSCGRHRHVSRVSCSGRKAWCVPQQALTASRRLVPSLTHARIAICFRTRSRSSGRQLHGRVAVCYCAAP